MGKSEEIEMCVKTVGHKIACIKEDFFFLRENSDVQRVQEVSLNKGHI